MSSQNSSAGDVGELRRRGLPERLGRAVDEDVDAAERGLGGAGDEGAHRRVLAGVDGDRARPAGRSPAAISSAASSSVDAVRAATTTSQPSAASVHATALPMPLLPPVTIARLPVSWRSMAAGSRADRRLRSSADERDRAVVGPRDPRFPRQPDRRGRGRAGERGARAAPPCRAGRRPASTRRSSCATAASATAARAWPTAVDFVNGEIADELQRRRRARRSGSSTPP